MTNDPFDRALQSAGDDPSPAFEASLETILSRAYDGEQVATPSAPGGPPARRLMAVTAAAILIIGVIATAIAIRRDSGGTDVVTSPGPSTTAAGTTAVGNQPAPSTSNSPVPTSAPPTSTPPTAAPTTTTSSTVPVGPASSAAQITIDLTTASPALQPTIVASYPIAPPGDLFPTAYAVPAGDDRIAVLDDVTGVVRFVEVSTGADLASYPSEVPTIGSPDFIATDFLVGPDDVLYVNVGSADAGPSSTVVAYGRRDGTYVEIARADAGAAAAALALGPAGVARTGDLQNPIIAYVDHTGQPSGATLDVEDVTFGIDVSTYQRSGRTWQIGMIATNDVVTPLDEACPLCNAVQLGPPGTIVVINTAPQPDGDILTRVTVLGDTVTEYDTDWRYVGVLGDRMLFTHLDQDSIDIGTVAV